MCGRYDNLIARDAYRALYRVGRLPASNFPLRYNIAPTDQVPIKESATPFVVIHEWKVVLRGLTKSFSNGPKRSPTALIPNRNGPISAGVSLPKRIDPEATHREESDEG